MNEVVKLLQENDFTNCCVALEFSQRLLPLSPDIAHSLQLLLPSCSFRILGEASCCPGEVAATRIGAKVIVHFGSSCFAPTKTIPVLFVSSYFNNIIQEPLLSAISELIKSSASQSKEESTCPVNILLDIEYSNSLEFLKQKCGISTIFIQQQQNQAIISSNLPPSTTTETISTSPIMSSTNITSFCGWKLPNRNELEKSTIFYVGESKEAFNAISFGIPWKRLFQVSPEHQTINEIETTRIRLLMRRSKSIDLAKDLNNIGLISTSPSWIKTIRKTKEIIKTMNENGSKDDKKCLMIELARIDESRLGNFPQCDLFAVAACPFVIASIICDGGRMFIKPVISINELLFALNSSNSNWITDYSTDCNNI